jgi:uncharacterized coiled-coil protein SlyX
VYAKVYIHEWDLAVENIVLEHNECAKMIAKSAFGPTTTSTTSTATTNTLVDALHIRMQELEKLLDGSDSVTSTLANTLKLQEATIEQLADGLADASEKITLQGDELSTMKDQLNDARATEAEAWCSGLKQKCCCSRSDVGVPTLQLLAKHAWVI